MNHIKTLVLCLTLLLALIACQKAVQAPKESVYLIKGNKQSMLYPTEVKQNSEDVFITLKTDAPMPQILSYDRANNKIDFKFTVVANTIVVPGKFEHLRLSHENDEPIDIIRQDDN